MKRYLNALLFPLGIALLGWMIWKADPRALVHYLKAMPWTLLGCVLVWSIGYGLNAASFRKLIDYPARLEGQALSDIGLYRLTVAGFAINYITPFGLLGGEPYRIVILKRYLGLEKATSSVLLYMTMHVLSHIAFWLGSCLLALSIVAQFGQHLATILGIIAAIVAIIAALLLALRLVPTLRKAIDAYARDARTLLRHRPRQFFASLGLEIASRVWNCLEYWLIFLALGLPLGFSDAILTVAFSSLFANLLFFSPLQMGTREGGIYLALRFLLPTMADDELLPLAIAVSFATRIREFVWIGIGLLMARAKY